MGYKVYAVMVETNGTAENARLLPYGVDEVFVYGHEGFAGFKARLLCGCCGRLHLSSCVRRWFWLAELLWDVPWHRVFLPASTLA